MRTTIAPGELLLVTDAEGTEVAMTAASGIEVDGHDFPVVWVQRHLSDGSTDLVPWPLESVRPAR